MTNHWRWTLPLAALSASGLALWPQADDAFAARQSSHQHEVLAPARPVPGESIYQLRAPLTDQNGKSVTLQSLRGQPALITMFYTSCQGVCPMLAFTLKRMEAALTAGQRARLRVAMVSFDPGHDTSQALRKFGELQKIDDTRWLLARTPEKSVRELAAVLGIRYRALPGGAYSHSATVILLDANGIIRAHTEKLQTPDPEFMATLRAVLDSPAGR